MRVAPLLLLAACSSPAPTTASTHPGDDVVVMVDAAPIAVVAPADATPAPPAWCLTDAVLDDFADGALVVCEPSAQDYPCYAMRADGPALLSGDAGDYAFPPTATVISERGPGDESVYVGAKVCREEDCVELRPKLPKRHQVRHVAVDTTGRHAAISIDGKTAALEVWDVAKRKRIARTEVQRAGHDLWTGYLAFLGDAVLFVVYDGEDDVTPVGENLWRLTGKKLKSIATIPGRLDGSVMVAPSHAAVVLGDSIAIYDVETGARLGAVDWTALAGDEANLLTEELVGADDAVGVLLRDEVGWIAGILRPITGEAQGISIPECAHPG